MTQDDRWHVAFYYGENGRKGNKGRVGELPGDLALQTQHTSKSSLDMEIEAGKRREDIGSIVWWGPNAGTWRRSKEE